MNLKEVISDYFTFTKREKTGLILLVVLILLLVFLPGIVKNNSSSNSTDSDTSWMAIVRTMKINEENKQDYSRNNSQESERFDLPQYDRTLSSAQQAAELFEFNPNTISLEEWKKLGLKNKTALVIRNYLAKGGRFYKPDDLKRIYGLHPNDYFRLEPFIRIPDMRNQKETETYSKKSNTYKPYAPSTVDINLADTTSLIRLPGIGSRLAVRIINFRDKLGGFYSISQVGETYGLPDSTFRKIIPYLTLDATVVKRVALNTVTIEELKLHPYFKYNIAQPIIAYRNEHGPFSKVEDLRKVMAVTEDVYNKISNYLVVQ